MKSNINIFLENHKTDIIEIIDSFKDYEFSSHDFIEKFSRKFETDYIEMLVFYKKSEKAFQTVHSQIAKFLSENRVYLKIEKKGKKISENTFGENDYPEWWNKLK